jgi:urea transport system permease protein
MLGGAFVLVVLFMPKGIVGLPGQIQGFIEKRRRRNSEAAPPVPAPSPEATDP